MASFATSVFDRLSRQATLEFAEGEIVTLRVGSWSKDYTIGSESNGMLILRANDTEPDAPVHAAKLVMGEIATGDGLASFGVKVVNSFGDSLVVAAGLARVRERRSNGREYFTPPSTGCLDDRTCLVLDSSRGGARILFDCYRQPGMVVQVSCQPWAGGAWVLETKSTIAGYELRVVRMTV